MNINVGVVGAGTMGTALAQRVSENVEQVILHVRKQDLCDDINNDRHNSQYYPNLKLNENIIATLDISDLKKCTQ